MKFVPFIVLILLFACRENKTQQDAQATGNEELAELFKAIDKFKINAEDSLFKGVHPRTAWSSDLPDAQQKKADSLKKFKAAIEAIPDASLTEQEKISKMVMLINLDDQITFFESKMFLIPFNAEGGFYNYLSYGLNRLPFKTAKDYYNYLEWLPRYEQKLKDNVALMKQGVAEGIVAPQVVVNNNLALLKMWTSKDYHDSFFYSPFEKMPADLGEVDRKSIADQSAQVLASLQATYQEVEKYFNEYAKSAMEKPGISFVPGGKEYYENRVRHYSTLPLTADSVHNLGLAEVARIRQAMEKIISDLKFKGSFADFLKFLRTDDQFYAKTPQELLNYAAWLSKKAEGQLPKYFNQLYTLPFTVEPVPASIAPTYTSGRYVEGSWADKRAGIYWVNTYNLSSRTLYTIPALTVHEAVPGHHLQGALAAEIKDSTIPAFRNEYYISAFGEGWALYCEYLGEEMGMYSTPYELFGRYTYEMWRACRLVVDTGIHYKGWSREDALKFLSENTALSMHEVTTEIDRYIGWPGQALSYKIGEIKIKELRKKAEQALGKDFNIGEFHKAILRNGSVPLPVLEMQVDQFIEATRPAL